MKTLIFIISMSLFAACNDYSKVDTVQLPTESSKTFTIKLIDSLGDLTVTLPSRYDTFFNWTHYSDCGKPCERIKYRFQPKVLKVTKESGWLWDGEPKDSIERFTVIHSGYFPFHDNYDSTFIYNIHEKNKKGLVLSPDTYEIKSDTVEKIGDRLFSVFVIDLFDTTKSQYSKKMLAMTTIKSNIISFDFELLTKQNGLATDNFLSNAKYYLRSIRTSNGK